MSDLETIGLEAVDKFITTWNSRDAAAWAGSLQFPHVRPSPFGPINVAETAEDYIAAVDYNKVIETGWDHSEWDYKHVLHMSPRKIHVAGQWTRYTASGESILSTPIVYVCTLIDGNWGIQSRFGSDYADEDIDTSGFATRGLNLVTDFINNYNLGNRDACAELLNYPHFTISPGELGRTDAASDFTVNAGASMRLESLLAVQTGQHSMNIALELGMPDGGVRQGVVNVTNRDGHLGIQAWSLLDPNEAGE